MLAEKPYCIKFFIVFLRFFFLRFPAIHKSSPGFTPHNLRRGHALSLYQLGDCTAVSAFTISSFSTRNATVPRSYIFSVTVPSAFSATSSVG